MPLKTQLTAAATALGLTLAPMAALAQDTTAPAAPSETQSETAAASFSEAQLNGFVEAAMAVTEVRDTYLPQLQAAETEEESQELQIAAQEEMIAAIEGTDGMDVETYTQIGQAAQTDAELQARISAIVEDQMPGQG